MSDVGNKRGCASVGARDMWEYIHSLNFVVNPKLF